MWWRPQPSCGLCPACRAGDDMHCANAFFPGLSDNDGGMAQVSSAPNVDQPTDGGWPRDRLLSEPDLIRSVCEIQKIRNDPTPEPMIDALHLPPLPARLFGIMLKRKGHVRQGCRRLRGIENHWPKTRHNTAMMAREKHHLDNDAIKP